MLSRYRHSFYTCPWLFSTSYKLFTNWDLFNESTRNGELDYVLTEQVSFDESTNVDRTFDLSEEDCLLIRHMEARMTVPTNWQEVSGGEKGEVIRTKPVKRIPFTDQLLRPIWLIGCAGLGAMSESLTVAHFPYMVNGANYRPTIYHDVLF